MQIFGSKYLVGITDLCPKRLCEWSRYGKSLVPSEPTNTDTISEWMFDPQTAIDTIPLLVIYVLPHVSLEFGGS